MKKIVTFFLLFLFLLSSINITSAASSLNGFDSLQSISDESQVIVVNSNGGIKATLSTYEKVDGIWRKALPVMPAVVGYNGLSQKIKEGDGLTPAGVYTLGTAFGWGSKPSGVKLPFRKTTATDFWVDDPSSIDYNKWITYTGNPATRWRSFERLKQPLYKYAVTVNYNVDPIVKGKGSAIFLHVWKNSSSPTAGCIAMAEENLVKVMKWIDPSKKPIIVMGKTSQINNILETHAYQTAKKQVADAQVKANKLKGSYLAPTKTEAVISNQLVKNYSSAKMAILKAQANINLLSAGPKREELQNGLNAVSYHQDRAARFMDAVKFGEGPLVAAKDHLEGYITKDIFHEDLAETYHHLSDIIKKEERIIGKVYAASTRDSIEEAYIVPAKIVKETIIYEVSIYELLNNINKLIDQEQYNTAKLELEKLDRLKERAIGIKEAGNQRYPGRYKKLPGIQAFLEKYEADTRNRLPE